MRHALALAAAVAALSSGAIAAEQNFKRGDLGVIYSDQLVDARPSYDEGRDLILVLKNSSHVSRLVRGLEARLFPLGQNDRVNPAGWGHPDHCVVFLTAIIPRVVVGPNGVIDLGGLSGLAYLNVDVNGRVSPGRFLLVFEQKVPSSDPLMRINDQMVEDYFRHAVYFEVTPSGSYDVQKVKSFALQEAAAAPALRARAEKVDVQVTCYYIHHVANEASDALFAALDRCQGQAEPGGGQPEATSATSAVPQSGPLHGRVSLTGLEVSPPPDAIAPAG